MNFDLDDEQKILAEQTRRLFANLAGYDRLRTLIEDGEEWDPKLWRAMAEMGLLGVAIPEDFGGSGMSQLDLGVVSQEVGRVCAPVPFVSSVILSAPAIMMAGSELQKAKWLPEIASGDTVATFVGPVPASRVNSTGQLYRLENDRLYGVASPVPDAGIAGIAILPAPSGFDGFVIVDLSNDKVRKKKLESFDQLRSYYELSFDGAEVEKLSAVPASDVLPRLRNIVATQIAFEAVGGAEECLYMARDYALQRTVFARPLASFQALKHRLADIFALIELARSNAYFAGWAADHDLKFLPEAAAAARLLAYDAYKHAARENLQIHGGIGYTFEANCHFHYRRERALATRLGNPSVWADQLIAELSETSKCEAG